MRYTSYFSFFSLLVILIFSTTPHAIYQFNWETLEAGMLKVHWYQGDASFGQAALETAQASFESIARLFPPNLDGPIEIFIYANVDDLRGALTSVNETWVAGHADPALGVIHVVVEPGAEQRMTMEQRIPHELMHVMMYRHVGAGYDNIPAWLREGTATLAEIYPNADYDRVLTDAVASHSLISLSELCITFPDDMSKAFLAYAESRSFIHYVEDTYSSKGLLSLVAAYADGVDCEHGPERAFGVALSDLEAKWRSAALGQNPFVSVLQNISPYLVLLCLVLVIPLVGIVSTMRKRGTPNESGTYVRK